MKLQTGHDQTLTVDCRKLVKQDVGCKLSGQSGRRGENLLSTSIVYLIKENIWRPTQNRLGGLLAAPAERRSDLLISARRNGKLRCSHASCCCNAALVLLG